MWRRFLYLMEMYVYWLSHLNAPRGRGQLACLASNYSLVTSQTERFECYVYVMLFCIPSTFLKIQHTKLLILHSVYLTRVWSLEYCWWCPIRSSSTLRSLNHLFRRMAVKNMYSPALWRILPQCPSTRTSLTFTSTRHTGAYCFTACFLLQFPKLNNCLTPILLIKIYRDSFILFNIMYTHTQATF